MVPFERYKPHPVRVDRIVFSVDGVEVLFYFTHEKQPYTLSCKGQMPDSRRVDLTYLWIKRAGVILGAQGQLLGGPLLHGKLITVTGDIGQVDALAYATNVKDVHLVEAISDILYHTMLKAPVTAVSSVKLGGKLATLLQVDIELELMTL